MVVTLIILALSAVFFVSGKIRSDVVALCALVLLLLFHILTPDEALSGFSNSVVIMMIGLFVVGGAIFQMRMYCTPHYPPTDLPLFQTLVIA